jgi:hypothetical protein
MAEVGRLIGVPARSLFCLCETGNRFETALCLENPRVFWARGLDQHGEYQPLKAEHLR